MQIFPDPLASPAAHGLASAEPRIYTVGHSKHSLARLLELLQAARVTAVADVRSHPFSQRHPQFNRPELEEGLKASGLAYVFLGDQLGGRPAQLSLYQEDGRIDYERVRATPRFRQGLERV